MTIAEYQTLTGITVSETDTPRVEAAIRKSEAKLEALLGYSLSAPKTWTELGKLQYSGLVPFPSLPVSDEVLDNLSAADDAIDKIQLFNFDELDKHIKINPAKEVYRAKVVLPVNEDEFITVYDLTNALPYLNSAGLVTAITRAKSWFTWTWWNSLLWSDQQNMLLAVEAEFVDTCDVDSYKDLAWVLADMVTYYSDPSYSLMGNVLTESMDSHSYSRSQSGGSPESMAPENQSSAKLVIEKYAGAGAFKKLVR